MKASLVRLLRWLTPWCVVASLGGPALADDLRVIRFRKADVAAHGAPVVPRERARRTTEDGTLEVLVGPGGPVVGWPLASAEGHATERHVVHDERVFASVASADPALYDPPPDGGALPTWCLAEVLPGKSVAVDLLLPESLPDGRVEVRVEALRTHRGTLRLHARLGDADLGTAVVAPGTGPATFGFSVRAEDVPAGRVPLVLSDRSDALPSGDPFDSTAAPGTLAVVRVVVDLPVGPHEGLRLATGDGAFFAVTVVDGDPRAFPAAATKRPPASPADDVAWLAVATPPLREGAERLAAHRRAQGLASAVVVTTDLAPPGDADALRAAIRRLATRGPARFLVLVGDADRDRATADTIPTFYARTLYNGATATDRPYGTADGATGATGATVPRVVVGRLPFAEPSALAAYVDRVVRAETRPPADATRRAVRFVTSEGRFGAQIDALIENLFAQVVSTHIPACYDVTVTFATARSPFAWPAPRFNDKVIDELNAGSLFFTYVGHGWWDGFDSLRVEGKRFPILSNAHVDRVAVRGTPPAMFVVACTTAQFDDPERRSIGERLLDRPQGPLAYYGATRVCHPAWNSIVGRQLAMEMFRSGEGRTLGELVDAATEASLGGIPEGDTLRRVIEFGASTMMRGSLADLARVKTEGAAMYALLGDPALRLPMPAADLAVEARLLDGAPDGVVEVAASGPLPDGAEVTLALVVPRTVSLPFERDPGASPEETMQRRHARANDKTVVAVVARAAGGRAVASLQVPVGQRTLRLTPVASATLGGEVHVGAGEPLVR